MSLRRKKKASPQVSPIDLIEQITQEQNWSSERLGGEQINFLIEGRWTTYTASFLWCPLRSELQMFCGFALDTHKRAQPQIRTLTEIVNAHASSGFFEVCTVEGEVGEMVLFRDSLPISSGEEGEVLEKRFSYLLSRGLLKLENYYHYFALVGCFQKGAKEALTCFSFKTLGEA